MQESPFGMQFFFQLSSKCIRLCFLGGSLFMLFPHLHGHFVFFSVVGDQISTWARPSRKKFKYVIQANRTTLPSITYNSSKSIADKNSLHFVEWFVIGSRSYRASSRKRVERCCQVEREALIRGNESLGKRIQKEKPCSLLVVQLSGGCGRRRELSL